jgi:surface protein
MRLFTFLAVLFFGFVATAQTADDFVFTVSNNNGSGNPEARIIITAIGNGTINWGNGQVDSFTDPTDLQFTKYYTTSGPFTVFINGSVDAFKLDTGYPVNVTQWGSSQWKTMKDAFKDCDDLTITASIPPDLSAVTDMSRMFQGTGTFLGANLNISNWDVSNVTDMSNMFNGCSFNIPIDSWDVSNVTNMNSMFAYTYNFNQPLNNWDVSSVTNMDSMFYNALDFNSAIGNWDVSSVTSMNQMFTDSTGSSFSCAFNQPIGNWDVSSVTDMSYMFTGLEFFNQPLDNWNVSNVNEMSYMFSGAMDFNQPLNSWDVSSVNTMRKMFSVARSFNQSLSNWDVSNVTDMEGMFDRAQDFNGSIDAWNVSNVTTMTDMFAFASSFNQPLNSWDVMQVTSMSRMFKNASLFNQPLGSWDVSGVIGMASMFENSTNFNQSLGSWDVVNVWYMSSMFKDAINFNQDLSFWSLRPSFVNFSNFSDNSGLDQQHYDALLRLLDRWPGNNTWQLRSTGHVFCDDVARSSLIQKGWSIFGDTQAANCPTNTITGVILNDFNNNGCDVNDAVVNNVAIEISNNTDTFYVYANNDVYSIKIPDGSYTISPVIDGNIYIATPATQSITIGNSSTTAQDFCLSATTLIDDLEVTILSLEDARPGFDTNYKLIYKNKGNTQLSGSVDFTYEDDFMDFLSSNPATTSSSTGMLSWDFIDLDPFETREIDIAMNLNTPTDTTFPLNSNDLLGFSATINPTANDDTPLDNVIDLQQTVVNSYDPNDKTCLQGETILPSTVGEYVHYRIRFENEGTASAVNVRIVDYIDTSKFDIATLTPLSASHDFTTTITEGNKVEFLFDNINLPFTAPASQGYVLFKIKTVDTLVLGDNFSNQAEIYFDFNFPIITNLETTSVDMTASLNDSNFLEVSLYPNPAKNTINVTSNLEFNEYTIYDTLGAIVSHQKLDADTQNYDLQIDHLISGLYFIKVKGELMSSVLKLVKE